MGKELKQFQADLLSSVKDMKAGRAAKITQAQPAQAAMVRTRLGLTQAAFSQLLGVSARTVQDWEQGRRKPTGAAQTLLGVASEYPDVLEAYISEHPIQVSA